MNYYIILLVAKSLLFQSAMDLTLKELQLYTQDKNHHGVNKMEILLNFVEYINQCQDPANIFRFMEEKAICTFIPEYWIFKAQYFAEIGQFRMAFDYMQQAQSRNGIGQDDKQNQKYDRQRFIDIESKTNKLLTILMNDIRQFPLKSKRSIDEYDLISKTGKDIDQKQKKQKIIKLYETKYGGLKNQKESIAKNKRQYFGKSWFYDLYERQDANQLKIQEMVHENSNRLAKEVKHHSMHTPIRYRDPQRLTKTMDSVEILKKKKSTNQKLKKTHKKYSDSQDSDKEGANGDWNIQDSSKMITSVPVGRKFLELKRRRVTFDMTSRSQLKNNEKSHGQNSVSFNDKSASYSILSKSNIRKRKPKIQQKSSKKDKQYFQQQRQCKSVQFKPKS